MEDVDEASGKDYHSDVVRVLGKPVKYAFNFRVRRGRRATPREAAQRRKAAQRRAPPRAKHREERRREERERETGGPGGGRKRPTRRGKPRAPEARANEDAVFCHETKRCISRGVHGRRVLEYARRVLTTSCAEPSPGPGPGQPPRPLFPSHRACGCPSFLRRRSRGKGSRALVSGGGVEPRRCCIVLRAPTATRPTPRPVASPWPTAVRRGPCPPRQAAHLAAQGAARRRCSGRLPSPANFSGAERRAAADLQRAARQLLSGIVDENKGVKGWRNPNQLERDATPKLQVCDICRRFPVTSHEARGP